MMEHAIAPDQVELGGIREPVENAVLFYGDPIEHAGLAARRFDRRLGCVERRHPCAQAGQGPGVPSR